MVHPEVNHLSCQLGRKTPVISSNRICCQHYLPDAYFYWCISLSNWKRIGRMSCYNFYSYVNMVPVSGTGRNLFQSHIGRFLWRYRILNPLGPPNHNNNARIFYYRTHARNNERSFEDLLETDLDSLEERFNLCGNSGFWSLFIVLSQLVVEGVFGPSGPKSPKLYRTGSDSFLSKNKKSY